MARITISIYQNKKGADRFALNGEYADLLRLGLRDPEAVEEFLSAIERRVSKLENPDAAT